MAAYDAVVNGQANWLLLTYDNTVHPEALRLFGSGADGLPELKSRIEDPLQVFIGFYREGADGFILLNVVPDSVSGVRRARVLVHSRRIGQVFQAHQTSLTVDHLSNLTPKSIRQALAAPDSIHVIQLDRVTAEPEDITVNESQYLPDTSSPPPSATASASASNPSTPSTNKGSVFSSLLRRKKKSEAEVALVEPFQLHLEPQQQQPQQQRQYNFSSDAPPPPPPKDRSTRLSFSTPQSEIPQTRVRPVPHPITTRQRSNSDYTVVSRSSSSDEVVVMPEPPEPSPVHQRAGTLPSKWNKEVLDPAERARRRREQQMQRELEEEQALREEEERQFEAKLRKEALLRQQEEEEAARKAMVEEELRRAAAQRQRRERLEKEEEERKLMQIEQKKRADRERRMKEHQQLEAWRAAQAAQAEELSQREERARKFEEAERRKKIQLAGQKVKSAKPDTDLVAGWVTMQTSDSLVWRRRYFKFIGSKVFFYRSQMEKDVNQVLDQLDLRGQIRGLREWNEGYEDLKAIPFSFAVEFKTRDPWSMYSDSEEEKYKLLGLLHAANGS
ncbi:hypothetical protein C8J57DRAFT_1219636 [Mycena rebaudengoi]|nr:hypothetical protein C8J57DRAFT_1219636 [Mycena rebaudengoi]